VAFALEIFATSIAQKAVIRVNFEACLLWRFVFATEPTVVLLAW
jgi:hypothetical protein